MIMPRYGINLEQYFLNQKHKFSQISIFSLGIRLIKIFEVIHSAGYVYNDLKLDNIMTGY